jgi:hypothetical protein
MRRPKLPDPRTRARKDGSTKYGNKAKAARGHEVTKLWFACFRIVSLTAAAFAAAADGCSAGHG